MSATALNVNEFHNPFLVEQVMAATDSLRESERNQQRPRVGESDVRVGSPAKDSLTQSFMPVQALSNVT